MLSEIITPRINPQWEISKHWTSWGHFHREPSITDMCSVEVHLKLSLDQLPAPCTLYSLLPEAHPCQQSHTRIY